MRAANCRQCRGPGSQSGSLTPVKWRCYGCYGILATGFAALHWGHAEAHGRRSGMESIGPNMLVSALGDRCECAGSGGSSGRRGRNSSGVGKGIAVVQCDREFLNVGVSETVRNLPTPATGGDAPGRWHPETVCRTKRPCAGSWGVATRGRPGWSRRRVPRAWCGRWRDRTMQMGYLVEGAPVASGPGSGSGPPPGRYRALSGEGPGGLCE